MEDILSEQFIKQCKVSLERARQQAKDEIAQLKGQLGGELSGDDGDISQTLESQDRTLQQKDKLEAQLVEIDAALSRIEDGEYGTCEETGEEISVKRLLAIPWTRYSAEGAEIVERRMRHYGKRKPESGYEDEEVSEDAGAEE